MYKARLNLGNSFADRLSAIFIGTSFLSYLFTCFIILALLVSLSACGGRGTEAKDTTKDEKASQQEQKNGATSTGTEGEKTDKKEGSEKATGKGEAKEENGGVPVEIADIVVKDISSFISSTTNIETENEATVLAETDGRVMKLSKEEGMRASKGEILAQLDDSAKLIVLKKAKAKAENEKANYERAQELFTQNLLSPDAFDKVKFGYEIARSEYDEAEYNLSKTRIVAPFDGRVTQRHIKIGQNIKPGDQLFTIANFDPLLAHVYLPEKDALMLSIAQEVEISVPWDSSKRYRGIIERISPIVDSQTGTVKVTVYARDLPDFIKPGSFVNVNIVKEVHRNAFLIPKRSVIKDLQEDFVFIVDNNLARKMKVSLGFEDDGYIEIISGISRGQKVISVGQGGLKDGSKIKIVNG